jgi:hypothetical protein
LFEGRFCFTRARFLNLHFRVHYQLIHQGSRKP